MQSIHSLLLSFAAPRPCGRCLLVALGLLVLAGRSAAEDRRFLTTPGIVIETGARHATCDALTFTKDGKQLLAAGDDKVVRSWPVGPTSFASHQSKVFRWPIFREQLGGIHALAMSADERKIAIAGYGMKPGMVAVLDRSSGEILHIIENPPTAQVTWAIAFSPGGDTVVYGTEIGEFFAWTPSKGEKAIVKLGRGSPGKVNRARLVQFLDEDTVLTVTQDGKIREWDVHSDSPTPTRERSFRLGSLLRVIRSPDGRWLAGISELLEEGDTTDKMKVRFLDYRKLRGDDAAAESRFEIDIPAGSEIRYPRALAFDETSKLLAVGYSQVSNLPPKAEEFHRVTGGGVHVYSFRAGDWITKKALDVGYQVNNIAFRPGRAGQLATAGGPNHEVRLWDYTKADILDTIRTPGSGIWGVAASSDGKSLAWREKMNPTPRNPNDRATGDWRVFGLAGEKHAIASSAPEDVKLHLPLSTYDGWKVVPGATGFVWVVRDPDGNETRLDEKDGLYFAKVAQILRCYTFIPPNPKTKTPLRLAVGHQWGASVYDLAPGKVRLARVLIGHEGEVMSVAASPDGQLLFTASRDQTIACWSLIDWPGQKELGAHLDSATGKLLVKKVELGSILWELGLTDGDEIAMVLSTDLLTNETGFVYDPYSIGLKKYGLRVANPTLCDLEEIARKLSQAQPWREYIIVWRHNGEEQIGKRRVQQRPLWRFFPTREEAGSDWILWRWRDYYYDASERADRLVGWHVNVERPTEKAIEEYTATPRFYRLESFRGVPGDPAGKGRHRPDKVWPVVRAAFVSPEKVQIADIEPPAVNLTLVQAPDPKTDPIVRIVVRPRDPLAPGQGIKRVVLWLDDSTYEALPKIGAAGVDAQIKIPAGRLRQGVNTIRLLAFNAAGGRAEAVPLAVAFNDPNRTKPTLYALCVGIDDYSKAKAGDKIGDLRCARADAEQVAAILLQHKGSDLFDRVKVVSLPQSEATAAKIAGQIQELGKLAKPDDLFVLFLSGHGTAFLGAEDQYQPGSFAYVCYDSDIDKRTTLLQTDHLRKLFEAISCRKLILLDACHSGAIRSSPTRDLNADGAQFFILSACQPHQAALEPNPKTGMKNGLFTQGLMAALAPAEEGGKKPRLRKVTASELGSAVENHLVVVLERLRQRKGAQTAVFFPEKLPAIPLLCRP